MDTIFFQYSPLDVDILCESLWHSMARADIPDIERTRMSAIREQLNHTRIDGANVVVMRDLSIKDHVAIAERHAQRAFDLSHGDEHQKFWVRIAIGRAQSILISLITNNKLK